VVITLLTDFGTADGFVAEMKGVLASEAPGATLVDLTHEIPAHDIDAARMALARCWLRFPPGTVHIVVVDPGVGGARKALAVQSRDRFLVGPDNGVLSPALLARDARVVALPVPPDASPTFHGRDVFAPAGARLARGESLATLGHPHVGAVVLRAPEATRHADGTIAGEIVSVDRFGNLITNIAGRPGGTVLIGDAQIPVRRTYGDVADDALVAVPSSNGFLEVALRGVSAAARLGLKRGDSVACTPQG
jgi:S-adenosylmethionine hydrolase